MELLKSCFSTLCIEEKKVKSTPPVKDIKRLIRCDVINRLNRGVPDSFSSTYFGDKVFITL